MLAIYPILAILQALAGRGSFADGEALCDSFAINVGNATYEACVEIRPVSSNVLFGDDTQVLVQNKNGNVSYGLGQLGFRYVSGYVQSKPFASSVSGFLEGGSFYGRLQVDSAVHHVEQAVGEGFRKIKRARGHAGPRDGAEGPIRQRIQYLKQKRVTGRVCSLLLLIDNSFLKIIGKNNVKEAVVTVLGSLDRINSIFRSTDFDDDGTPDNIGFKVKHVVIIESEKAHVNLLPKYTTAPIDGKAYLTLFSKNALLSEVCLGAAFTAQPFLHHALGLSYTGVKEMPDFYVPNAGGICERPGRFGPQANFNNLVISYCLGHGERVSRATADLSLAHELGHSFGSDHDETPPCFGHLMTAHTFNKSVRKNLMFSECSKRQIVAVLKNKGQCLEAVNETFCGNGIVEEDEDCDCGPEIDCVYDACCTSRGNVSQPPCRVNKAAGYECHPSQGLCCKPNCRFKDVSHLNLNCVDIENKCPCRLGDDCPCGLLGGCLGDECHSSECTRIQLRECLCPANAFFGGKCGTCCLNPANGKCEAVESVTETALAMNASLARHLKRFEVKAGAPADGGAAVKRFCREWLCVSLSFRRYAPDGFCTIRGELGMCGKDLVCKAPQQRQVFPRLKTASKNGQASWGRLPACLLLMANVVALAG